METHLPLVRYAIHQSVQLFSASEGKLVSSQGACCFQFQGLSSLTF
jgi:hypothetical protein